MSDARSQMVDWDRERKPWDNMLPKWYRNTPPHLRSLRQANPYWPMWKQYDEEGTGTDEGVLDKQHDDAMLDADETDKDRAKGASAKDVALLRQSREQGQRFRTDERVPSHRSSDYEFLEGEEGAEKWQRTKKL